MKKTIEYKAFKFEAKELNDQAGTFEGYVGVFGNIDEGGDILEPGSATRCINSRKGLFPLVFAHQYDVPAMGKLIMKEDAHGLFVTGTLFKDRMGIANDAYENLKEGVSNSMSFAYRTLESEYGTRNGQCVRLLKEVKIYEGSLLNTGFGMNELAGVSNVKGMEDIEAKVKALEALVEQLKSVTLKTDFQKKIEEDLNTLRQAIGKLTESGTLPGDGPVDGLQDLKTLIGKINTDLKS